MLAYKDAETCRRIASTQCRAWKTSDLAMWSAGFKAGGLNDGTHSKMYRPECNNDLSSGLNGSISAGITSMNRPWRHQCLSKPSFVVNTAEWLKTYHAEVRSKQHRFPGLEDPHNSGRHCWQSLPFWRLHHTPKACCSFEPHTRWHERRSHLAHLQHHPGEEGTRRI